MKRAFIEGKERVFISNIIFNKKNKQLSLALPKRKLNMNSQRVPKRIKLKIEKIW